MATRRRHDLEPASRLEIEAAVHPFIERFILKSKKERAMVLFSGRHRGEANDLIYAIDRAVVLAYPDEAKALAAIDKTLPGVYLDSNKRVFRITFGQVWNAGFDDHPELFISHNGICGLVLCTDDDPWLLTRKPKLR